MEAPTITELQDFTLKSYVRLLEYLKQRYRIIPFCDVNYEDTPYLILRHDIDISPSDALTMAKIEKDLNVKSTYFVLFSSTFYNLFQGRNIAIIKQISELGHEIGLHYHPAQYRLYNQNPEETLKAEIQLLESFLGKRMRSISRHGPWDMDSFASSREYVNANHPYLRADLFVHESNRAWTTLKGLLDLLNNPHERVQLLIHSENWQEAKIDRESLLRRHTQVVEKRIENARNFMLDYYKTDPLVIEYEKSIKNTDSNYLNQLPLDKNLQTPDWKSLFRYYLIHTKIGWNLRKTKGKIKREFARAKR
jgi:peptidoglycan/xylan/chitin deacetylase (PgdA/CDA1 family)